MHTSTLNGFGIGFKPEHFMPLFEDTAPLNFIEIHAENYMGEGGLPHAQLRALREKYQLSLHGVGLSIGGETPLDKAHLAQLKRLIAVYKPESFSEHLAWSSHNDYYYNDLLPICYDEPTLKRVCAHINEVQNTLSVQMLLENPSTYLSFAHNEYSETAFIKEIVARTDCALLLDVNNIYVSAINHAQSPYDYLKNYPLEAVKEIHLAGFAEGLDEEGARLLIDSHSTPISQEVWQLYASIPQKHKIATLIEWDNDVPSFDILKQEAMRAKHG